MGNEGEEVSTFTEADFINNVIQPADLQTKIDDRFKELLAELKDVIIARVSIPSTEKNIFGILQSLKDKECIKSIFSLHHQDNICYIEVSDKEKFVENHSSLRYNWIDTVEFVRGFCNVPFQNHLDGKDQSFARLTLPPYDKDPCEVLEISEDLKEAFIRIVPRADIPKLGMTVDKQVQFNVKQALKMNLPLQEDDIHISFSNPSKVARGYSYQDMQFEGKTAIMKVSISNLSFNSIISKDEKKLIGDRIKYFTHERRDNSKSLDSSTKEILGRKPRNPRTKDEKKDEKKEDKKEDKKDDKKEEKKPRGRRKSDAEKKDDKKKDDKKKDEKTEEPPKKRKAGRPPKKKPEPVEEEEEEEEENEDSESSASEAQQEEDYSESFDEEKTSSDSSEEKSDTEEEKPKPGRKRGKSRSKPEIKKEFKLESKSKSNDSQISVPSQKLSQVLSGRGITAVSLQYRLNRQKSNLLEIPIFMRNSQTSTSSLPIRSLVELPTREVGVITKIEKDYISVLIFTNRNATFDIDTELPSVNDDNSVHDRLGRRVFPGDVIFIKSGKYANYQGSVIHTRNNRVFGEFSLGGDVKPIWASGREIVLIEDDLGPVDN